MRLFVAFSLPPELSAAIVSGLRPLSGELPAARWVSAENLHLTLHFLGEGDEAEAARLGSVLRPVFARHQPVPFALAAAGAFPAGRPRVVWLGLDAPSRLCQLQQEVVVASDPRRQRRRQRRRPFRAHVTLARCRGDWSQEDVDLIGDRLQSLAGSRFQIEHGLLYESVLGAGGASYSVRQRFPLRGVGVADEPED